MSVHSPSAARPACLPPRSCRWAADALATALRRISRTAWLPQTWVIALLLSAWAGPAQAEVQWLRQAQTLAETRPQAPATPPTDWSAARSVALPDEWPDDPAGPAGIAWYRLVLDRPAADASTAAPAADTALYGLYVERACSVLQVWLNGHLVHDGGRFDEPVTRNCHRPQLVPVAAALLQPGANKVDLRIKGYPLAEVSSRQRAGGVSEVEFGPYDQMAAHHARRLVFAIRLPEVMSGALVLMGSFMFVMGWFNRAQSHLAYFGALMVGWSLLLARLWAADLPLPNGMTELALAGLMSFITLAAVQFLMRYAGHRLHWLNIALPAQCLLMPLSLVAAGPQRLNDAAGLWSALLTAQIVTAAVYYLAEARRQHTPQFWSMAALLSVMGLSLAVGLTVQLMALDARIGYVAELVPALGFLALGLRLVQQFGRAYQSAEQDRAELEVRIREATAQIERNFAQLSELKVEQVTERERKRIAADLHDDLGAKLLTIVHTSDSERISTLAREALEEMRLSVRGLTGKPVKLIDALGDWRAEVVSRLTQSGVQGEWSSPSDEEVPHTLSSRAYVQTTRILREAVSNIIKHSGASQCSVRCTIAQGDFQLVIQDNGKGIPMELDGRLDKGHGMASMKGRAKQLQGQCLVESGPGYGTVIRLTLPLERHTTGG
jgi:signal transduction histidine kinase